MELFKIKEILNTNTNQTIWFVIRNKLFMGEN